MNSKWIKKTAWMDLKSIMLSERSQSEKSSNRFHSYVESNEQNELTSKILTDS